MPGLQICFQSYNVTVRNLAARAWAMGVGGHPAREDVVPLLPLLDLHTLTVIVRVRLEWNFSVLFAVY